MIIKFELSMPNVGSWNGKWTGADRFYARTRGFYGKERLDIAKRILEEEYYHYDFGDGWAAGVTTSKITSREAARVNKNTRGFCGYEWMIDSIIKNNAIVCRKDDAAVSAEA